MGFSFLLTLVICTLMVMSEGVVKRSDDVNTDIQTLQTLVQQQAAAISSLQSTVSALQATVNSQQAAINSLHASDNSQQVKITGLESKVQTLSKSVAFTAKFSGDPIPLGPHQTLVFDNVVTNAGNGYDPTTGIFRAPLAGNYAFSIDGKEDNGDQHPSLSLGIMKNGAVVAAIWLYNAPNDNDEQGSTHSVLHLATGDQVWIRQDGTGDSVRGNWFTVFTGFLVHAD